MKQMDFDDYTMPIEAVVKAEGSVKDGEQLFWVGERFYTRNPKLLDAHKRAAAVFESRGRRVPPKALTEFVRWMASLGRDGVLSVVDAYSGVDWDRDEPYAMSNDTTPWLGRCLKDEGFDVDIRKSKIDEVWEREHGAR